MIYLTVPPQDQGDLLICYAHAIARQGNKSRRVSTGVFDNSYYEKILNLAIHRSEQIRNNDINPTLDRVLAKLLELDYSTIFPIEIYRHLKIEVFERADFLKAEPGNKIKIALAEKRHVIFEFQCMERVFNAVRPIGFAPVTRDQLLAAFVEERLGNAEIVGHALVLYKWENGLLYFTNSYGKDFGQDGQFCMEESVLQSGEEFVFGGYNLCFDDHLPEEIRKRIADFSVQRPRLPMPPEVWNRQIVTERMMGEGHEARIYEGKFYTDWHRFGKHRNVAIRYLSNVDFKRIEKNKEKLFVFDHPNVVEFYGFTVKKEWDPDDIYKFYVAMERANCSLDYMYDHFGRKYPKFSALNGGALGWGWFYFIVCDVAAAIQYLHKNHITHTDICMANVVITARGIFKIIDLQTISLQGTRGTRMHRGHVGYYDGNDKNNIQNRDWWCLGSLMCHLLSGSPVDNDTTVPELHQLIDSLRTNNPAEVAFDINMFANIFRTGRLRTLKRTLRLNGQECEYVGTDARGVSVLSPTERQSIVFKSGEPMVQPIPYRESTTKVTSDWVVLLMWLAVIAMIAVAERFTLQKTWRYLSSDVSFLSEYDAAAKVPIEKLPYSVEQNLYEVHNSLRTHANSVLDHVVNGSYVTAVEMTAEMTSATRSAYLPYVCLPENEWPQSEYVFGNPVNLKSAGQTVNSTWKKAGFDILHMVREVDFQTQLEAFRSIEDDNKHLHGVPQNGNRFLNTTVYNIKPVCFNPVWYINHIDELRGMQLNWTKPKDNIRSLVERLNDTKPEFFMKQTVVALPTLCKELGLPCRGGEPLYKLLFKYVALKMSESFSFLGAMRNGNKDAL